MGSLLFIDFQSYINSGWKIITSTKIKWDRQDVNQTKHSCKRNNGRLYTKWSKWDMSDTVQKLWTEYGSYSKAAVI